MKKNKLWLAFVSLLVLGCSTKTYEHNKFSKIKGEGFQIHLAPTLEETEKKAVYGNPYSFCFSYKSSKKVRVDINLELLDLEGKLVRRFNVSNFENEPNIFSLLIDEEITLRYINHTVRGALTVKDAKGLIFSKKINNVLFYEKQKNSNELLH